MKVLRDMEDIIEIIKDVLSKEINGKVFDKHVAEVLNINALNLATMKKRGKIPFENIVEFTSEYNLDLNMVLVRGGL